MKKFIVLLIVLLMLAGFAIASSATAATYTLWAGQNTEVGTLTVEMDVNGDLVVTYIVEGPWELGETHLYVGTSLPKKKAPGRFPYGPLDVVEEGKYVIDLEGLTGWLYIAAHAVVTNPEELDNCEPREETAWASGCTIPTGKGKNWAMFFWFWVPE